MVRAGRHHAHLDGGIVFRFEGCGELPGADLGLPLVPVRLSSAKHPSGFVVNCILDSGASDTVIPYDLAEDLAIEGLRFEREMETAGGEAKVATAQVGLDIVDSYFPSVAHWAFRELSVQVADPSGRVALPLIGWDILQHFDTCFHPEEGFILLRAGKGFA